MHMKMNDWLSLDDEIKQVSKILKTLKDKQKSVTNILLNDMKDFQVGFLTEGTQQLKYQVSFPKQGYKKDYIRDKLTEYLKDANLATELTEHLESSRPRGEKVNLRRGKLNPLKQSAM